MPKLDVNVSSIDMGWEEFLDKMGSAAKGPSVTVGVHAEDAPRATDRSNSLNNAELLALHEFGGTFEHPGGTPYVVTDTGVKFVSNDHPSPDGHTDPHEIHIPTRSTLRAAFKGRGAGALRTTVRVALGEYFDRGETALAGLKRAMGKIGKLARSMVRARFASPALHPNAPSTIRHKGHALPLIGKTGQLRAAINYQVHLEIADFVDMVGSAVTAESIGGGSIDASQF